MTDDSQDLGDLFTEITGQDEVTEQQEDTDDTLPGEQDEERALPKTNEECPECQNEKAYFYLQQTRAADESETRFFICPNCNHKWRDYD